MEAVFSFGPVTMVLNGSVLARADFGDGEFCVPGVAAPEASDGFATPAIADESGVPSGAAATSDTLS